MGQGRPSPSEAMMYFPLFQISSYFRKILRLCENFFEFPPYFSCFSTFPPVSGNFLFPPYFSKCPPVLEKFTCFTYFMCISFPPYFDHDAFMHHPMYVLDALGIGCLSESSTTDM